MHDFDWNQYEDKNHEFDWGQYENPESLKATEDDKSKALSQIKKKFPGMPDFLVNALISPAIKMAESPEKIEKGSVMGAFLRAGARAPLESAENLASLIGLPINKEGEFPLINEKESDKSHPFAELSGGLSGFLAPGAAGVSLLRSIPLWGKIAKNASPSLLRRLPVYGSEGAALGAAYSPEGHRDEGSIMGALLGAGGSLIPTVGSSFSSLKNRLSSLRNLDRLKEEGVISNEDYLKISNDEKALQQLSETQGLGKDVTKMEADLPLLSKEADLIKNEINEIPKINIENMLPSPTGEELIPNAEALLKSTNEKLSEQEAKLSEKLGKGESHRKKVASILNPLLEERQAEIGRGYDSYINNLNEKNIELSNPRDAKQITSDIHELIKRGDLKSPELTKLVDELEHSGKKEIIPADKFVSAYRSLRQMAQKTRSNAYGKSPQEFDRMIEAANSMDKDVARMEEVINKGLGEDNLKELHALNKRYSTEIAPLFKNKFFLHMQANSKAPKNMISQLTNEPYIKSRNPNKVTGSKILNDIIKNDPELLRNVLGERFANNPKDIHLFDEEAAEFINHHPELKSEIEKYSLLNKQKQSHINELEEAKIKSDKLNSEHERINESFKEETKKQKNRSKKETELDEINQKIENLKRNIPELKKKSKQKEISLSKKIEIENKISETEKDITKLKNRAAILAVGLTGSALGFLGLRRRP